MVKIKNFSFASQQTESCGNAPWPSKSSGHEDAHGGSCFFMFTNLFRYFRISLYLLRTVVHNDRAVFSGLYSYAFMRLNKC